MDRFPAGLPYPDRIAQRREAGDATYRLSNGRGARLSPEDPLSNMPWLAVARLGAHQGEFTDRIFLACGLYPELFDGPLSHQVSIQGRLDWDAQTDRLRAQRQHRLGALIVSHRELTDIPVETRRRLVLGLVRSRGLKLLPWTEELRQWQARVMLLRHTFTGDAKSPWPDVSDERLLGTLGDWLAPYLDGIGHINHFTHLNLTTILQAPLPQPLPRQLDKLAPSRYAAPSGARLSIDYSHSPPVLAVRLQEMFGCGETPRIAHGRVTLKLHLLSPPRRPVQITEELAGFWRNGYSEVRKEMKSRYPKHHWPDDPLSTTSNESAKGRE